MKTEENRSQHALPVDSVVHENYRIGKILGEGGFGITYEGFVESDQKRVAIKEYYPSDLVTREYADSNGSLHIFHGCEEKYEKGLRRFMKEAAILREFQYIDGIVSVLDFFEEKGTAYIVMEYIEGITLKQYVAHNGVIDWEDLVRLVSPIMKALAQLHRKGLIHRDISPDNLLIGLDNQARLIDFGAANQLDEESDHTQTVILKNGYAPPEQYLREGKQGSWTDVYAMAATMFMGLTGRTPLDAVARLQGQSLAIELLDEVACESWQRNALLAGLELQVADRYKTMSEFYTAITVAPSMEDEKTSSPEDQVSKEVKDRLAELEKQKGDDTSVRKKRIAVGIIVFVLILGLGVYGVSRKTSPKQTPTEATTTQMTTTELATTISTTTEDLTTEVITTEQVTTEIVTEATTQAVSVTTQSQPTQKVPNVVEDNDYDSFKLGE